MGAHRIAVLLFAGASLVSADGPEFSGTWKINLEKSQFAGQSVTITKAASGLYHFVASGFEYDFDLTGNEYPTPDGGTTAWKSVNASTWEAVNRMNGKIVASYRLILKGNTLTALMQVSKPDGTTLDQTTITTREGGGQGFLGIWKTSDVKGAPTTLEIRTDGAHITLTYPEFQTTCTGAFDGKDYVVKAANADSKQTFTFQRTTSSTFRVITKMGGKPLYIDNFTLSANGKTLTDDGNATMVNEPIKAVYEK